MKQVHISFQIIPAKENALESYEIVDKVIGLIQESGIRHITGPMETTLEGDYDEIMKVVKQCHELCLLHADKLISIIKIHAKKEHDVTFEEKKINPE
ncbi:MAG: thiamine-binding protein [Cyclobacteriaceae bacterium]|nr:thiamine-binding protein [Cyclobacteriaceae bacterium]